jgi:hypothetical protein
MSRRREGCRCARARRPGQPENVQNRHTPAHPTFWKITDRLGYLWTSGFKPRWETYDGSETPVQLRIDIQHGSADIEQVARDIFGLTKLNYNACKLGYSEPVTVGFSDAVGEILVSNPTIKKRDPRFKFYI